MKLSLRIEERDLLKHELKNLLIYITDHMIVENYKESGKGRNLERNRDLVEGLLEKLVKTERRHGETAPGRDIPRDCAAKSVETEVEKTQSPSQNN